MQVDFSTSRGLGTVGEVLVSTTSGFQMDAMTRAVEEAVSRTLEKAVTRAR